MSFISLYDQGAQEVHMDVPARDDRPDSVAAPLWDESGRQVIGHWELVSDDEARFVPHEPCMPGYLAGAAVTFTMVEIRSVSQASESVGDGPVGVQPSTDFAPDDIPIQGISRGGDLLRVSSLVEVG